MIYEHVRMEEETLFPAAGTQFFRNSGRGTRPANRGTHKKYLILARLMSDPMLGLPLTVHPSDRAIRAPAFGGPRIIRMRALAVTTTEIITVIHVPSARAAVKYAPRAPFPQSRRSNPMSRKSTRETIPMTLPLSTMASADGGHVPLAATLQSRSCPADRLRTARHDLAQGGTAPTPSARADRRRHRPVFRSSRKPGPARYSICLPVRARGKAVAGMERDRREPMTGYSRALFIPVTFRVRNATVE